LKTLRVELTISASAPKSD